MSFLSQNLYNCKYGIFVAKNRKYGIFVAKIYKYALIDRFQGSAGFLDSAASLAALSQSNISQVSYNIRTSGPKDWTPGFPGSDKNSHHDDCVGVLESKPLGQRRLEGPACHL